MDILCEIDPIYQDYMVTKGNQKVLNVHITEDIYGNASLSHAFLLQTEQGTAQLWLCI